MIAQKPKRATIHDVANEAGVSYQTVSRVINSHPNVARKTRARVFKAIEKLDYQPVQAARNLSLRSSKTLQIIAFNWNHYSLQSIILTARKQGYEVNVSYIHQHDLDELNRTLDRLAARLIDGAIIIAMPFECPYDDMQKQSRGIPITQLGGYPNERVPYVGYDQTYAARLALNHLLDLGHRRIAEISGSSKYPAGPVRHTAIVERLQELGLSPAQCVEGEWNAADGYAKTLQLLERDSSFTALICGNDPLAQGAMWALQSQGYRVPEDVSVISFDDIAEAAYFNPPLTTVRQDFHTLGVLSVDYLIELIKNPSLPIQQRILFPELIVRNSTAAPAA